MVAYSRIVPILNSALASALMRLDALESRRNDAEVATASSYGDNANEWRGYTTRGGGVGAGRRAEEVECHRVREESNRSRLTMAEEENTLLRGKVATLEARLEDLELKIGKIIDDRSLIDV